jgi:hypothetical protein
MAGEAESEHRNGAPSSGFSFGAHMTCQTQKQQVLRHLRSCGSITTFVAFKRYNITRLSERIREIERDGCLVNHTRVTRNGRTFVAYSLVEGKQQRAA